MATSNQGIDLEAAEWAVRLHSGTVDAEAQRLLDAWLERDPRHRGALVRAQSAWLDLDRLAALAVGRVREESPNSLSQRQARPESAVREARGWRPRGFLVASLVTLVCGLGLYLSMSVRGEVYSTSVGGVASVALRDGSHITLNSSSRIRVDLGQKERQIELQQGEAFFEVAKDPKRPFVVQAGSERVIAVGTKFSVRRDAREVRVVVTEGTVRFETSASLHVKEEGAGSGGTDSGHEGRGGTGETLLAAGTIASATDQDLTVQRTSVPQAERRLVWREGMVDFDGATLTDAVAEMNRHNYRHIVVDDPALATRPVVGVFRTNDPENFAATVAIALGAQSVQQDDAIHLRAHAAP